MKKFLIAAGCFACAAALLVVPVFGGVGDGNIALGFAGAGLLALIVVP